MRFSQIFYTSSLGFSYEDSVSKNIYLKMKPALVYAHVHTKDKHLLRDFYTTQEFQTYGYEVHFSLSYMLSDKSKIAISYNYHKIVEKNTAMNYYNIFKQNYLTYPSSYKYTSRILTLGYSYKF